jgi:hypothetical protein
MSSLIPITSLFEVADQTFLDCMNETCHKRSLPCGMDADYIMVAHRRLDGVTMDNGDLTDTQRVDVEITRIWLKIRIWQVCVSHSLLVLHTPFGELDVDYPLSQLGHTRIVIRDYDIDAFKGNGRAMVSRIVSVDTVHRVDESLHPSGPQDTGYHGLR